MFSQNERLIACIAFLIAPFLMLGHANNFTELPELALENQRNQEILKTSREREAVVKLHVGNATTSTLFLPPSNSLSIVNSNGTALNLKSEVINATSASFAATFVASSVSLEEGAKTDLEREGKGNFLDNFYTLPKQTDIRITKLLVENPANESEGNDNEDAVAITQTKYAVKQRAKTWPTAAATAAESFISFRSSSLPSSLPSTKREEKSLITAASGITTASTTIAAIKTRTPDGSFREETAVETRPTSVAKRQLMMMTPTAPPILRPEQTEQTLVDEINERNAARKRTMRSARTTIITRTSDAGYTPTTTTTTSSASHEPSDLYQQHQLRDGLFRIKLPEIVTDEFKKDSDTVTVPPTRPLLDQRPTSSEIENQSILVHPRDMQKVTAPANKINITPSNSVKINDFSPIIRDSNLKLLKERTIFSQKEIDEAPSKHHLNLALNLMSNGVEGTQENAAVATNALELWPKPLTIHSERASILQENNTPSRLLKPNMINHRIAPTTTSVGAPKSYLDIAEVNDFTGKLLAEQDGVITEIERKFRMEEFSGNESHSRLGDENPTTSNRHTKINEKDKVGTANKPASLGSVTNVNHKTVTGFNFIDRRVKKSFEFPMHRMASDTSTLPHVDFASTKFNTEKIDSNVATRSQTKFENGSLALPAVDIHPEFSTTKFYNSKELHSQLFQQHRKKQKQLQEKQEPQSRLEVTKLNSSQSVLKDFTNTTTTTKPIARATAIASAVFSRIASTETTSTTTPSTNSAQSLPTNLISSSRSVKEFHKELKRGELLVKNVPAATQTTLAEIKTTNIPNAATKSFLFLIKSSNDDVSAAASRTQNITATIGPAKVPSPEITKPNAIFSVNDSKNISQQLALPSALEEPGNTAQNSNLIFVTTNAPITPTANTTTTTSSSSSIVYSWPSPRRTTSKPTKSISKPFTRPRILSRLQERINSLECNIQNIPLESTLWHGNETHELMLPFVITKNCKKTNYCTSVVTSWEGEAEIQSGDILIVEINDAILSTNDTNATKTSSHAPQVYQVTRSGHEHCDVTEGILLDITPLAVDGRKLVTLYDKDLTEGVNLLIVVSELWGSQCVRLKVTTKTDNCGENADCSGKGVCFSNPTMEEYECQCCSGFSGPHCEEIDACTPSPCTNNGICVDLSQGHDGNSYQCLCPYGYTGKNCQYEADPCNPAECMNGGSCVGNSTHFRCDCTPGFTGPLCQHSLNECESSPCVHGICVDQEDGFRCFCQPGFAGELCNFEYNECESNPCQNAGECIDHIGSYECRCTKGFTGSRCQIKVDLCANKPCPAGHHCFDHGNDFTCDCPEGQNGPDCNQLTRMQCNVNPCTHGGTCWSSGDSFYCACRPGYTGTMCEDEFVVETVISSSEFMVDDASARNFNEKTYGSAVVLRSPMELHNAYFAAGVLAAALFIVGVVVTICHCKVNQTYRKFSTRSTTTTFFPILGFGRRPKSQNKLNKHWLSGKGLVVGSGNPLRASSTRQVGGGSSSSGVHLPGTTGNQYTTTGSTALLQQPQQPQQQHQQQPSSQQHQQQISLAGQLHERPYQRHMAMNLENDMYYTAEYGEASQHSPLIQ